MLQALRNWLRPGAARDPVQIEFPLAGSLRGAEDLLARLRELGLKRIERCTLTKNRRILVSWRGAGLRIHEGYLDAPLAVHQAIVAFVEGGRAARLAAQRTIGAFPIVTPSAPVRAQPRVENKDEDGARLLAYWHRLLNRERFGDSLRPIRIRISRRMRSRLGHYTPDGGDGRTPEIGISARHLRCHGLEEALQTLLHEMVHQWQHESGLPIDHGRTFRRKARAIGITPAARRTLAPDETRVRSA
ncbi:MAG: hypothetical protein NVS1B4_12450 [Gemmatimonadaceae bacterium]